MFLTPLLVALAVLGSLSPIGAQQQGKLLQTFSIKEVFGVSHPQQIIDFDFAKNIDPDSAYMIGPEAIEVPYQLLSNGKIAIQTDLPANAELTWKFYAGRAPAPATGVAQVTKKQAYYEITNELTGVRVPLPKENVKFTPAPIQGIRTRNGQWTGTGPNYLSAAAKKMSVRFLENGPLKVVIQVSYTYDRPEHVHKERGAPAGGIRYPAGEGFYSSTIEVQAGQPSILIEEDTDMDVSYSLNIYDALHPNQARYRGHQSTSKEAGYEFDGQQYRMWHARPSMDAFVNLTYAAPKKYLPMAVWDPWVFDSGWYWQMYDSGSPANSNLFGIFAGRASRAIGASNSGVNVFTKPLGVNDLVTRADGAGNIHSVYQNGDDLWYMKFDKSFAPGKPEQIATEVLNADLLVNDEGRIHVVAFDRLRDQFIMLERAGNGQFTTSRLADRGLDRWKITDPFAYQAASGDTHFVFLYGEHKGKQGGLLFARKFGEKNFAFQDWIPADAGRQIGRPTFATLPDGRVALLFMQGHYAELAYIDKGQLNFGGTGTQRILFNKFRYLNFGSAIDPQTGNIFVANSEGALSLITPAGQEYITKLGLDLDHDGQGPNRRTLATAERTEVLAVHGGQFYRYQRGKWDHFFEANALNISTPRVHFHKPTGQFVIVGRNNGKLTLYTWKPGEQAVRLIQQLADTERRATGFQITTNRRSLDGLYFPRIRFSWGLFTGIKGEDLKDPRQVQPIARQMNLHGGVNLNKIHRYDLTFPDPKRGYGALYLDGAILRRNIKKLRQDRQGPHGNGFYGYLYAAEPTVRDLLDMWADMSGTKTKGAAGAITGTARDLLNALVNGDGIYDFRFHYWHGGLEMMRKGVWIDSVLADGRITFTERASVKAAAALFANILWDNDFVPLFTEHGLNLGTENMPVQQQGYRNFYALLLADHPMMQIRAKEVASQTIETLRRIVNEHGAEIGSPHYIGASFVPILNLLLQIRMLGNADPFKTEDRLSRFADFYLNFLTPPEVRFGGTRKLISVGDGSSESSQIFGPLATGFSKANPDLSARLMGAWHAVGKPHSGFFGSTVLMINEEAPFQTPALANASFPGWYSVLRHGWGTKNETALWFINGDFYRDHRHYDHGSLVLYALGAPLSIDWGSMYSPHVPGGFMHSVVLPTSSIKHAWDQDSPPLDGGVAWTESKQEAFVSFNTAAYASASFRSKNGALWTRSVSSIHPREDQPIIAIRDQFAGSDAKAGKVFSLNLMAEGKVDTPAGPMSPTLRSFQRNNELPSAGKVIALRSGLNRFGFTGQWLIDWDLYTVSLQPLEAQIGNWAHNWHPLQEQSEFTQANGRAFEERQHILRIKGNGPFQTLILPYRKGQKRGDLQVKQDGAKLTIVTKDETTVVADTFYAYRNIQKRVLASFDGRLAEAHDITITGGPVEVILEPQRVTITAHGKKGLRAISLPGAWSVKDPEKLNVPLTFKSGRWLLDYQGESPVTVTLQNKDGQ
jgi:hypothetical protein